MVLVCGPVVAGTRYTLAAAYDSTFNKLQYSAHHHNRSIFRAEEFLIMIKAFVASLRLKVYPNSGFWVSRPSPGKRTQERPRIHAPVRSRKMRETYIIGDGSECSSDEEDMDASLPAVEKQGKAERGVLAF